MKIKENVEKIRAEIAAAAISAGRKPTEISLIAATKMNSAERVKEAIAAGVDACGENRVQELTEKNALDAYKGAPIHFIGHLQKNKVKYVVGLADIIESVDSMELAEMIAKRAEKLGIVQRAFLEVNIGREPAKSGVMPENLEELLEFCSGLQGISVKGLMAIPPIAVISGQNRRFFAEMRQLFVDIRDKKYDNISMDFLSMGMSGDFTDAIKEGANMVRVGTGIFGPRNYT